MARQTGNRFLLGTMLSVSLVLFVLFGAQAEETAKHENATPATSATASLSDMSLEDLLNVEVTSVSKKAERRSAAAAAIFVITQEDIRRAGVTRVPDALRMVPGISVAQITSGSWAVTSRGFNGGFANKLLVLIDGRSVYGPMYAGVFWCNQELVIEDIERIEVIRGPGGALWGANAVNGVINIITKKAQDTQGGLATVGGGTDERGFSSLRYGGQLNENTYYRVSGKYFEKDAGKLFSGKESNDDWDMGEGSFRIDTQPTPEDSLTLSGNVFGVHLRGASPYPVLWPPYTVTDTYLQNLGGEHLLARWTHAFSEESNLQLQAYYDRVQSFATDLDEVWETIDLDFQHQFKAGERHTIVWGAGIRYVSDSVDNTGLVSLDPEHSRLRLLSGFVSDEITLVEDKLRLSIGSKFEGNDYTGFEVQPSVSLAWTPDKRNTLWVAVSRAVRTPTLIEAYGTVRAQTFPLFEAALVGSRHFDSEVMTAYEAGYRIQVSPRLALDATAYYNVYRKLRSIELAMPELRLWPPRFFVPFEARNNADATTRGFELAVDAEPAAWWHLRAAWSYFWLDLDTKPKTLDPISGVEAGNTPEQQFYLLNGFTVSKAVEFNWTLRYCDRLKTLGVPSYFTMDAGLIWRPTQDLELSVIGQNLVEANHPEFTAEYLSTAPSQAGRGVYGKVAWRF